MTRRHFLVLAFGAQGHLNPALQFSNRLLRMGVDITLATTIHAQRRMALSAQLPAGIRTAYYSDGYDDGFKPDEDDRAQFVSEIKRRGIQAVRQIIAAAADEGSPFDCLVYCLLLPWAAAVARDLSLPSALLWIQPATVFDIYYYNFHGFGEAMQDLVDGDPSSTLTLPGLEAHRFARRDLPSVIVPKNGLGAALEIFREHMEELDAETCPRVLVNTFDALELEAVRLCLGGKIELTSVGPLIPSAYLDGDTSDRGSGVDLFQNSDHAYVEWLDKQADSSVIYVSFGSMSVLCEEQVEEVGRGLLEVGKPFLWIMRNPEMKCEKAMRCMEELVQLGVIVGWCSQLRVLSHPAIGCFLTHCGWNSTLEGVVSGVPMVGFPQWTDQLTNAKLVEDYWKMGVRVRVKGDGLVERDEIKRCLEVVMGNVKMVESGSRWRKLAIEAAKLGGGSDRNLRDFIKEVVDVRCRS